MFEEFEEYIHSRIESSDIEIKNNKAIESWQERYKEEYERLLLLIDDKETVKRKVDLLLEIVRTLYDIEKEMWYSVGFVDGVELKGSVENLKARSSS